MSAFIHPCYGCRVTSPFGPRTHPRTGEKNVMHRGVDLAKAGNIPILAAASGTVREAREMDSYGIVVIIQHLIDGKRMDTTYAHLRKGLEVKKGDKVKQGQRIGFMGNTGGSTGQHLHFEIHNGAWVSGQRNAIDPLPYITTPVPTPKPAPAPTPKPAPAPEKEVESLELLNKTGRIEIRLLLHKARKAGIIDANFHTDAKIEEYTDLELLSYQAAIVNRTFK